MLGERIRDSRKEKGITVKGLADMVNVTPGYISQIERDLIDPSLSVLRRISAVLEIPLTTLFSQEAPDEVVLIPKEKRMVIKFADINMEYEFLTPSARNRDMSLQMEVISFKLAPKSWGGTEIMAHAAAECTVVLRGVLEYHIRDKVYTIEEQGCLYIPEKIPHRLYNPGDIEVHGIGIIAPPVY